jgi:hypothetical protein
MPDNDSMGRPKGLKITNEKSTVAAPLRHNTEAFQQAASEAADRLAEYKKRSWDLGVKFKGLMESSILPENKSALIKDLESETLSQLSQLANDINTDDGQPEGAGSVALSQLIMKMLLLQKDMCSQQKYKIEKLEKLVDELVTKIERLENPGNR